MEVLLGKFFNGKLWSRLFRGKLSFHCLFLPVGTYLMIFVILMIV